MKTKESVIRKQIDRLKKRSDKIWLQIETLQQACTHQTRTLIDKQSTYERYTCNECDVEINKPCLCQHENHDRIARSNAGGYDPSNDSYWYEITCHDCGAFYIIDQDDYNKRKREGKSIRLNK